MPKHEPMTPKAIANRIKSKGLQKLRWYCQMCQKQCRDENGFKCHTTSESHQRQLLLFADNPHRYLDGFSQEFEKGFMDLLSRRFGTRRVHANVVYQEYIHDRNHLHMNATKWVTLTGFVKWLGREGKCVVDQTEKGWFITWIDREPETIRKEQAKAKKKKMDKDDEERLALFVEKQVRKVQENKVNPVFTELMKSSEEEKVSFKLPIAPAPKSKDKVEMPQPIDLQIITNPLLILNETKSETKSEKVKDTEEKRNDFKKGVKRKTNIEELMDEEENKKERLNRKDYWIAKDIVVKIVTKSLGEKYYKKKAVVIEVKDRYVGIVQVTDSPDILKLDQVHLETVIPAIGRRVLVLNGAYRDHVAVLTALDEKNFSCTIKIDSGVLKGRVIERVQYEDISKLHTKDP